MSSEVSGQFVTPQNTEHIPIAAHRDGEKPVSVPNRKPKLAPMKKEGTISPPLYPAPRVKAVNMIFSKKEVDGTEPSKQFLITSTPVPL